MHCIRLIQENTPALYQINIAEMSDILLSNIHYTSRAEIPWKFHTQFRGNSAHTPQEKSRRKHARPTSSYPQQD